VALAFCWADILLELDAEGRVAYATGALDAFLGCGAAELVGRDLEGLVAPAERARLQELLAVARRRERIDNATIRLVGPKGITPPMAFSGYQLQDLNGHFFVALRFVQAARKPAGFGRRTPRDEETGLVDGDAFLEMVTSQLASGGEAEERQMSLIVLPRFEELQSRLVEAAEQDMLAAIGMCLQDNALDGETAARLGPDRYGLVHAPELDLDDLRGRIAGLTRTADPLEEGVPVEAATLEMDGQEGDAEAVSRGVSYALKRFRRMKPGENVLASLSGSVSKLAREAVAELSGLREMIAQQDFKLVFQPVLNARTGANLYYEALSRIPERYGIANVYEQILFAEDSGLIEAFDIAVLQKLAGWMEKNTALNSKVAFGVNVSGLSICSLSYLAQVDRLLKASPWLRGRLTFEITQSARIAAPEAANKFLQRLREQGFRVALDDFGTGAANFDYLSKIEVDLIKFDGKAMNAAHETRQGKAFVKALVAFSRELGVATVAETIEDERAVEFARACGVQFVQGFLFGEPRGDLRVLQEGLPNHLFPERMRFNGKKKGT
jgi:EAL domain-containing protein (putative c-di-GMP-specific phosphodiesterase class I)/GGDEF domain-containing protein